jgi:hypothetical protein
MRQQVAPEGRGGRAAGGRGVAGRILRTMSALCGNALRTLHESEAALPPYHNSPLASSHAYNLNRPPTPPLRTSTSVSNSSTHTDTAYL